MWHLGMWLVGIVWWVGTWIKWSLLSFPTLMCYDSMTKLCLIWNILSLWSVQLSVTWTQAAGLWWVGMPSVFKHVLSVTVQQKESSGLLVSMWQLAKVGRLFPQHSMHFVSFLFIYGFCFWFCFFSNVVLICFSVKKQKLLNQVGRGK